MSFNFKPFPELSTRHFILRQLGDNDDNDIFILRSDPQVMQYLDHPKAENIEDARAFISKINSGINKNESIYWVISSKDDPRLLGTICFWNISNMPFKADIGFELLPEQQGKGVMQEVIPEVLNFGFKTLKFEEIIGEAAPGNIKSIKMMEKFGFTLEIQTESYLTYILKNENNDKKLCKN